MKYKISLIVFLVIMSPAYLLADHIFNGTMSYSYIANSTYSINMSIYRDCNSSGTSFDTQAIIAVYKGETEFELISEINTPLFGPISIIEGLKDDCVTNDGTFCIEKGSYSFLVGLPISDESYYIVYQRCCRSTDFSNIDFFQSTGITVSTEINTAALLAQNNSPVFNDQVFYEVCNGDPFSFNNAYSDSNADSIIYELCLPLSGGGPLGTPEQPGDPHGCDGVQPIPPCSPPFDQVYFNDPTYYFDSPLGTGSELNVDRLTGDITGTASLLGQFLVGYCATEYINGEVVSYNRQDLIFRVDFLNDYSNIEVNQLSFYPNPATDNIFIEIPSVDQFDLFLKDVNGKTIKQVSNISGSSYQLSTEQLKGLYFLEMRSGVQVYVGKVVIL